jgi:hypothetical protein
MGFDAGMLMFFNDDVIALKEAIGFVRWQMELVVIIGHKDGRSASDFSPIAKVLVIGESKFAQAHKGEEASE